MSAVKKLLLVALLFLAPLSASAFVTAALTGHRCTSAGTPTDCTAPLYVYFDASGGSCSASECAEGWVTLNHDYNFNDPSAGTWVFSGENMNIAHGPVAFHVFETPGTYNVVVTSTARDGTFDTETVTITVDDPTAMTTACVRADSSGSFTGCTGTQYTNSNFGAVLTEAYNAGARYIRFQGGGSYTNPPGTLGAGPVRVDTYGTGRITVTANGKWQNGAGISVNDWVWKNIDWRTNTNDFLNVSSGDNHMWFKNSFTHTGTGTDEASFVSFGNNSTNNAFIGNGTEHHFTGNSWQAHNWTPCIWPPKNGSTIAGIYPKDCSRLIRQDWDDDTVVPGLIIQHNRFTGRRAHNPIEIRGVEGASGASAYMDKTLISYNWFGIEFPANCYNNECRGLVLYGDGNTLPTSRIYRTLIENNIFADGTEIQLRNSDKDTVIRNNLFEDHTADGFYSRIMAPDQSTAGGVSSWAGGTKIYNNTFHVTAGGFGTPDNAAIYFYSWIPYLCGSSACEVKNNLVFANAGSKTVSISQSLVASGNASRNGVDAYDLTAVDPLVDTTPDALIPSEWELSSAYPSLLTGPSNNAVIADYLSRKRPVGSAAVGAMGGASTGANLAVGLACSPDGGPAPVSTICTATVGTSQAGTGPNYRFEFDCDTASGSAVNDTEDVPGDATPGPIDTDPGDCVYNIVGPYTAKVTLTDYGSNAVGGTVVGVTTATDTVTVRNNVSVCPVSSMAGVLGADLWNASSDTNIDPNFQSGDSISASIKACAAITAKPNTYLDTTNASAPGSVYFVFDDGSTKCENIIPYAYPGNTTDTTYECATNTSITSAGAHSVVITPYDSDGCTTTPGNISGPPLTINYTVN